MKKVEPAASQSKPTVARKKASSSAQDQTDAINLTANLVVVPVSVTDALGHSVSDLRTEDFLLEEDGRPQQVIALGEPGETPLELALLFDVSGSVHARFQFQQQAALRFLNQVYKPNDAVSIFSIGLKPKLVQPRTTDREAAMRGLITIEPTKEVTAFLDAVAEAAQYVGSPARQAARRVLVVISDGEDTNSDHSTFDDVLRVLQQNDCLFYAINPSGPAIRLNKISVKGQRSLEMMAVETGGMAFLPDQPEDLHAVFRQIASELQAQYLLGYYPADVRTDGRFRHITVRVLSRSDLRVRARQGYYAVKS